MSKLTKSYIDGIQPYDSGYKIHWDNRVSGFGVRGSPSRERTFVAQGRVQGKAVIFTIGRYGLFTEDQARRKAQAILRVMREGIDPRALAKAENAPTILPDHSGETGHLATNQPRPSHTTMTG